MEGKGGKGNKGRLYYRKGSSLSMKENWRER